METTELALESRNSSVAAEAFIKRPFSGRSQVAKLQPEPHKSLLGPLDSRPQPPVRGTSSSDKCPLLLAFDPFNRLISSGAPPAPGMLFVDAIDVY